MKNQDKRIAALAKKLKKLGYEQREAYWYCGGTCTGFAHNTLKLGEPPERGRREFWQPKWTFKKSAGPDFLSSFPGVLDSGECWFGIDVTVDLGDDVFTLNLTAYLSPKVQTIFQTDASFGPRPSFSLGAFGEKFLPNLSQAERQLRIAISFLTPEK
jgi:hypothetical protein